MSSELRPPEPWHSFLRDLDDALQAPARLDCIGGFVVTQLYGLARPMADVDVIELAPREASEALMQIAMQGGPLHRKHRIYLDRVGVAAIPENYEDRLTEMFPGAYRHLRLMALFVTTSSFSPSARETADFLSKRIVLIDGNQLAELMIRQNIGCRIEETLAIKNVDEEFFEA